MLWKNFLPFGLLLVTAGFIGCEEKTLASFSLSIDPQGQLLPEGGSHHLHGKLFSA